MKKISAEFSQRWGLQATYYPSQQWFKVQIQVHKPAQVVVTNQAPNHTLNW